MRLINERKIAVLTSNVCAVMLGDESKNYKKCKFIWGKSFSTIIYKHTTMNDTLYDGGMKREYNKISNVMHISTFYTFNKNVSFT